MALGQDDEVVWGCVRGRIRTPYYYVATWLFLLSCTIRRACELFLVCSDAGDLYAKTLSQRPEPGRYGQPSFTLRNAGTC